MPFLNTTPQTTHHPLSKADRTALNGCARHLQAHFSKLHHQFWRMETDWRFQGAWLHPPKAWQQENLLHIEQMFSAHTTDYEAFNSLVGIRVNQTLREQLLSASLGMYDTPHAEQSALDYYLIQHFYTQLLDHVCQQSLTTDQALTLPPSTETVHFVYVQATDRSVSPLPKLLLSLPLDLAVHLGAQLEAPKEHSWTAFMAWNTRQRLHIMCPVSLQAGSTSLPIGDLRALEPGDLLVMENSNAQKLGLIHPKTTISQAFPVQYNPERLEFVDPQDLHTSNADDSSERETSAMTYPHTEIPSSTRDDLWNQLHVDVHAEFKPMRIPIQELRHMSEGLIVEVGDLLDNEIQLVTNGNVVAHGQLVVVGDKFGVLLTQVPGYEDSHLASPLSDSLAPEAPIHRVDQQHQGDEVHGHSKEGQESGPTDFDTQFKNFCESNGLNIELAQQAMGSGINIEEVVRAAQEQGMRANDYLVGMMEQNGVPMPEGYGNTTGQENGDVDVDDLDEELDRTTAMMQEMEEILDETED